MSHDFDHFRIGACPCNFYEKESLTLMTHIFTFLGPWLPILSNRLKVKGNI